MADDIKKYLNGGSQTKITPLIKNIVGLFKKEGLDLILEILKWLKNNFKKINSVEGKNKIFRQRTASEIIENKIVTGCTDYALVFIALCRAKKIPTKYIEAIRRRWLDIGEEKFIEGHVFAECFFNGKWYIIDPQEGTINVSYQRFVVFKEGIDSWGIGINNFDELKKQFLEFREKYRKN